MFADFVVVVVDKSAIICFRKIGLIPLSKKFNPREFFAEVF